MTPTAKKRILCIPALAIVLFLAGCPKQVHIADLQRNPNSYRNRQIAIVGTASESFAFMGQGAFHIDDGTGKIWVMTGNYGVPGNGQRVGVVGNLVSAVSFGNRSFGTAVQLTEKPHY